MTVAGFDVHARCTHGAAVHVPTGELVQIRFGAGVEGPVRWLGSLPGPVRACYEAGPTGFGLYRAAVAAGIDMRVVAPGKTPRGSADRVKTDRKDAELLARLLLAGSLKAITVPTSEVEAARELMRAHDAARRDLMTARHRVSKQLLATAWSIRSPRRGRSSTARGYRGSRSRSRSARWRSPMPWPPSTG
jgi:transposase